MNQTHFVAYFEVRSEAERAASQLHAYGVPESVVTITHDDAAGGEPRDEEVGGPDSSASLAGLQGGGEEGDIEHGAGGLLVMTIDISGLDVSQEDVEHILSAAGGRLVR